MAARGQRKPEKSATDQAFGVIDRIYDVAIDPTRYEELLDHWEEMIRPFRARAIPGHEMPVPALDFESHFQRASQLLDSLELARDATQSARGERPHDDLFAPLAPRPRSPLAAICDC